MTIPFDPSCTSRKTGADPTLNRVKTVPIRGICAGVSVNEIAFCGTVFSVRTYQPGARELDGENTICLGAVKSLLDATARDVKATGARPG